MLARAAARSRQWRADRCRAGAVVSRLAQRDRRGHRRIPPAWRPRRGRCGFGRTRRDVRLRSAEPGEFTALLRVRARPDGGRRPRRPDRGGDRGTTAPGVPGSSGPAGPAGRGGDLLIEQPVPWWRRSSISPTRGMSRTIWRACVEIANNCKETLCWPISAAASACGRDRWSPSLGPVNVGKSSILNRLARRSAAIVTADARHHEKVSSRSASIAGIP